MANFNSNVARAKSTLSRNSSGSSLSSGNTSPIKKNLKTEQVEIEIPKSIFELGNPDSHRAVILPDQKLFKKLQDSILRIINSYMSDSFTSKEVKNNLMSQSKIYYLSTFQADHWGQSLTENKVRKLFKSIFDHEDLNPVSFKPLLQIGTSVSNILHKDNGIIQDNNKSYFFDYTVVIPIMDYDLTGNGNHNFTPQSTNILPMEYKSLVPDYDKKKETRLAVGYRDIPDDTRQKINKYLVSEPLTQGTAIIFRTTTQAGSEDDGKSVIHESPKTPSGFTRIFIIGRANKK